MLTPATAVVGVGELDEATPPTAFVPYQFKVLLAVAVAINEPATSFWQYETGVVLGGNGVAGCGLIVTEAEARELQIPSLTTNV